ncbi:MAG: hypothetical protein M1820_004971 [Bogoriella megaspora]|nr:MAG: hypothetical protein M1820_004971 [Bogoriella megaspora]
MSTNDQNSSSTSAIFEDWKALEKSRKDRKFMKNSTQDNFTEGTLMMDGGNGPRIAETSPQLVLHIPDKSEAENGTSSSEENQEMTEEKERGKEQGGKCQVKTVYAEGNARCSCCIQWADQKPNDRDVKEERDRYAIVYRVVPHADDEWKTHSICINSPRLKSCLAKVFENYPGIDSDDNIFEYPFAPFVHRWERLLRAQKVERDLETTDHLRLLRQLLERELREPFDAMKKFAETGLVSFDNLIYALVPGEIITGSMHKDEPCASVLYSISKGKENNLPVYTYHIQMVDSDGLRFGIADYQWKLEAWSGTRQMTSLQHFPLRIHPEREALTTRLLQRGRKFEKLIGQHLKFYSGEAQFRNDDGKYQWKPVVGRVLIDAHAFFNLQDKASRGLKDLSELGKYPQFLPTETTEIGGLENAPFLTDEQCIIAVPHVPGFALDRKDWCEFSVSEVADIEWNPDLFKDLVLDEEEKELLLAFVAREKDKNRGTPYDPLRGKGRGTIILLCGPPGVGKTLSAESVAEEVRQPLYRLTAGDLGTSPTRVESQLRQALERCARWNAVLLIDEADVFLECRAIDSLDRNELVSSEPPPLELTNSQFNWLIMTVFLKLVEYYDGIMILTTNRPSNIDPAFESRIDVTLAYNELTQVDRRNVWRNFIKGIPPKEIDISDENIESLADIELDGRQINSAIKTGRLLALKESVPLNLRHLKVVLNLRAKAKAVLRSTN